MKRAYERWLVLPDIHIPYHDTRTFDALEKYIEDVQKSNNPFVGWLQLGDFLDLDELSRYNVGYEASIKGNLAESFERGNTFLDRHQELMSISKKPFKMVLLQGNHDYRTVDFGKKYPHLSQHTNYEHNLRLEERGIRFVKSWENGEVYHLGHAGFIHGIYTSQNHSRVHVTKYLKCIYYGHVHDVQETSLIALGDNSTIVGKSLGCLCLYQQEYLKGKPTNWQQAFAEFFFFKDGFYQEHTTRIFNHRFVGANGKVYQG